MKKILFLMAIIFIVSCTHEIDQSPKQVNYDRDICVTCLMGIAEIKYAVQTINKDGKALWYDDIGCYVEYLEDNGWKKFIAKGEPKTWISDADTGDWLDIKEAFYRYGDRTPMGYGYGAVKENKEGFFNYNTTIQRIKDGKTNRESFLKKHKMMKHSSQKDMEGGMKCAPGKCGGK